MGFVSRAVPGPRAPVADHVRDRGGDGADREDPRPPAGYGGEPVRIGTAPTTSARTTSTAPCSDALHPLADPRGRRRARWPRSSSSRPRLRSQAWHMPDQGIWEARGEPKHYVSPKLMSWVALDRAGRLARGHGQERGSLTAVRREAEVVKGRDPRAWPERPGTLPPALLRRCARRVRAAPYQKVASQAQRRARAAAQTPNEYRQEKNRICCRHVLVAGPQEADQRDQEQRASSASVS